MKRLHIDILGVCETWWPDSGKCKTNGATMYYSGNQSRNHRNGVGIIVSEAVEKCVKNFLPYSDRTLLLQIHAKPLNINIIQTYAPTADKTDEAVESFYNEVEELMKMTKKHEINIIMGDFNAKIGKSQVEKIVGPFGLGTRNPRGDRLIQFCTEQELKIMNTWFCLPPRRLYTWKSPEDNDRNIIRNHIDFILINQRYSTSVSKVSMYPGADVPSDHNLLISQINIKLAVMTKSTCKKHLDLQKLKEDECKTEVTQELNNQIKLNFESTSFNNVEIDEVWDRLKSTMKNVASTKLGPTNSRAKQKWMTSEILNLMDQRRMHKNRDYSQYKRLQTVIRSKIRSAKSQWLNSQCQDIETFQNRHDMFNRHKKIKETAGEYIEKVFNYISRTDALRTSETEPTGPSITTEEIKRAIKLSKNNKAPGPDELPAEIFKLIDDENLEILKNIFNKIYDG
ncbi:craniofacial development protein 2-like [Condylostylus longicornis]|uniref:craniofacial development protein 2-like n=1 Tax=Condylostylus longicornis TaxID=2530218 RepID=UPI00244E0589|nr:craniofacial development protein 2-like [Condylostylus longicornis]